MGGGGGWDCVASAASALVLLASASAAMAAPPAPPASTLGWTTEVLTTANGAQCLDGTPPGYHIQHRDPESWSMHLQGGGWCVGEGSCAGRATTALGSSKSYRKDMDSILGSYDGGAHGIFSSDPVVNPDFHNFTKAYIRYCDGGSFSGNVDAPIKVSTKAFKGNMYYRGHRILDAVLDSMLAAGLTKAKTLIVNGCSAGGLSVYLHIDYIRSRVPESVRVVGVPECGLFMDETAWDSGPGFTPSYMTVAKDQNVSGSVNADCIAAYPTNERWKCFMAQYTLPYIKTPTFIVNSFYDAWQSGAILHAPGQCYPATCAKPNASGCPAQAVGAIENMRKDMVGNQSAGSNAQSSAFLYACHTHCGQFAHDDRWNKLAVGGVTLREAFTEWLLHGKGSGQPHVDCDGLGCNPTCCT